MVGSSGSGKTTLARALAERLGGSHIELDALYHGPDWTPPEPDDFRRRVGDALDAAEGGWVCCGNYSGVQRPVVWPMADTVVVLDLPKATVMRRVVQRTVRRVLTREELWNGNREPFTNLCSWDPEKNVIRWAWVHHERYRDQYRRAATDPTWAHLDFVFLTTPREVDQLLARTSAA